MNVRDAYSGFGPYSLPIKRRFRAWLADASCWIVSLALIAGMYFAPAIYGLFAK